MEKIAKLKEVSDQEKRRVLKFEGLGIVSEFKDDKDNYVNSADAQAGKWYKVTYYEKKKDNMTFRNLSGKLEETEAPSGGSGSGGDKSYARLGALKDALMYFDIMQRTGQLKTIDVKMVEALTNAFYQGLVSQEEQIKFDFEKYMSQEPEVEDVKDK